MFGKPFETQKDEQFKNDFLAGFQKLKSKNEAESKENLKKRKRETIEPKENKHAALAEEDIRDVKGKAENVMNRFYLQAKQQIVWNQILEGNSLAQNIISCDLPTDDILNASLVKVVHNYADPMLLDSRYTWLQKIINIALFSRSYGYGNCQEKAFFAFAYMLYQSQKQDSQIKTLRLATFNNHFILIVNEEFLMDPWLNLAFPISKENKYPEISEVFKGFGKLIDYYSINKDMQCFTHQVREGLKTSRDIASEAQFSECLKLLAINNSYFQRNGKSCDLDSEPFDYQKLNVTTKPNTSSVEANNYVFWNSLNSAGEKPTGSSLKSLFQ